MRLSCCQTRNPERKVEGNAITSENDPKVRIDLLKSVQYVGANRWVLYGIADCELHAFVEADQRKNVQSLYWLQFEDLMPTGFSAAELQKGGKAYDRWPAIEKDLIERSRGLKSNPNSGLAYFD